MAGELHTGLDEAATTDVRSIGLADLGGALTQGYRDFAAKPSHYLFLGLIYPIVGLFLARLAFGYEVLPMLFPLAAGFALLGPLAAIGLYEMSRRLERDGTATWSHALGVFQSPALFAIVRLGSVLVVVFLLWLGAAQWIYSLTVGDSPPVSIGSFLEQVFTTPGGWALIIIGNAVGFVFAAFTLSISVVSFPLLLDRGGTAFSAVRTSLAVVQANPVTIAVWGLVIAIGLVIGSIPLFIGLAFVMPIFGHATWHLYRSVVPR